MKYLKILLLLCCFIVTAYALVFTYSYVATTFILLGFLLAMPSFEKMKEYEKVMINIKKTLLLEKVIKYKK